MVGSIGSEPESQDVNVWYQVSQSKKRAISMIIERNKCLVFAVINDHAGRTALR